MSTLGLILIVVLIVVLVGGFVGRGSYGASPYYTPGIGLVGLVILILLILVLTGTLAL